MLEPILPLSTGHLTLCLASVMLDGLVKLDSGPVVVKAISTKEPYLKSETTELQGAVTIRAIVKGERPKLRIRVLDQSGNITEYT